MDDDIKVVAGETSDAEIKEVKAENTESAGTLPEKKSNNLGLFSMAVLSLVLPGFVGIILGIIALVKSHAKRKTSDSELIGASFVMSIIGIVMSVISIIAAVIFFGAVVDAIAEAVLALSRNGMHFYRYYAF